MLVAAVGVVALVPYLVLQFQGLGIIVSVASYGAISRTLAIWIGAATVTTYVMISGMHGVAWNAVVKDVLILAVAIFLGVYLPLHYYGGFSEMFHGIDAAKPGFLVFKPTGQSVSWFQSTVLLTALGFFMWPHAFSAVLFEARADLPPQRRAAAALSVDPAVRLLLRLRRDHAGSRPDRRAGRPGAAAPVDPVVDPWFVGIIGAAGVMTALVPGSIILISAATLLANDVLRPLRRELSDSATA